MAYYTYQEGLWDDAFHSSCFLGKFVERCPPEDDDENLNEFADIRNIVMDDPEPCYPFIPHSGFLLYKSGYIWNQIVIYTFWFFLDAPGEMWTAFLSLFEPKIKPKEISPCDS
ncbi:hypothetical protein RUM43_009997 [Polyplax serrata]|uniref:Uncharacterized protein n=1 Tax=Polyplax serrata TaxID=468196 RepID=A0AAN8Q467_POLSC